MCRAYASRASLASDPPLVRRSESPSLGVLRRTRPLLHAVPALLLAACAGVPTISALHDPLYRAENHTSNITVRAREPQDGIAEIQVNAIVGELTACPSGIPSVIPCRQAAVGVGMLCVFPNVKTEVSCTLPLNITPRRLVTYTASTRSAGNRTASAGAVTYAGGAPLTEARVRFGSFDFLIPFETARPVVWRTDAPAPGTSRADKIDFGFMPDADMPNYRAFTDDMQPMLLQLHYTDTNAFSTWTRVWKNLFNLWAGPVGADGQGCTRTFNSTASNIHAVFDGTAILHRSDFRDCASISLGGGSGTAQTNLDDATWVLLHESGHFLFGLGDEYDGGGNSSISAPRNVYGDKATCESNSTANSLPATQCAQIGTTGTWRNDDGQATTMDDRQLDSDWRTLSGRAMSNKVSACSGGSCY